MTFNEKLVTLRKDSGMSQDALAEKLGVSRQAVSKWELGTAMPETKNIVQLAEIFGVTTDYLLGYVSVQYPDFEEKVKNCENNIIYWFYIGVTALFWLCVAGAVISFARKIIWVVRGISFLTMKEWLETGLTLGYDHGTYALVFAFFAIGLFAIKLLIKKFSKEL